MSSLEKDMEELKTIVLDMRKGIANTLEAQNNVIHEIHMDVKGLQKDVEVLQHDVKGLKDDVRVLQEDVKILQDDVKEMKETQVHHGKRLRSIDKSMIFLREKVFEHEEDIFHLKRSV